MIGEALEKQGRVGEALLYYEKALERDREEKHEIGYTFFLKRLDILYYRAGRYEDCLRISEYYTKRHPENWDAWNRLKRAAKKTGNSELSSYAKKRADEIRNKQGIAKRKAAKATNEPRPNIRGKPLPKEEALAGWEITDADIEKAQRWVDRAMEEQGGE